MISLLAYSRIDGWAFVQSGDMICEIRPPYVSAGFRIVDMRAIEHAVLADGFFDGNRREFPNWHAVVLFLNAEVASYRAERGTAIPEPGIGEEAIEYAPDEILSLYLHRIRDELLPTDNYESAEKILLTMLRLSHVRQSSIGEQATILLQDIAKRRKQSVSYFPTSSTVESVDDFRDSFPLAGKVYGIDALRQYSEKVRRQPSFLSLVPA